MPETTHSDQSTDLESADNAIFAAPPERGLASTLQPGQTATVYVGAENRTFRIYMNGVIERKAKLEITVDDKVATTLTFDARSTIVNGRTIRVTNRGPVAQSFAAAFS